MKRPPYWRNHGTDVMALRGLTDGSSMHSTIPQTGELGDGVTGQP